mgnify:CR=1 FL=1|jgi:hypothetical protein
MKIRTSETVIKTPGLRLKEIKMKKLILSLLLALMSTATFAEYPSSYFQKPKFTSNILGFVEFGSTTLSDVKRVMEEKKCKQLSLDRPSANEESSLHSFYCEKFGLPGDPIFYFEVNRKSDTVSSVAVRPKDKSSFENYYRLLKEKYGHPSPKTFRNDKGEMSVADVWEFSNVDVVFFFGDDWFIGYLWKVPGNKKDQDIKNLL